MAATAAGLWGLGEGSPQSEGGNRKQHKPGAGEQDPRGGSFSPGPHASPLQDQPLRATPYPLRARPLAGCSGTFCTASVIPVLPLSPSVHSVTSFRSRLCHMDLTERRALGRQRDALSAYVRASRTTF